MSGGNILSGFFLTQDFAASTFTEKTRAIIWRSPVYYLYFM